MGQKSEGEIEFFPQDWSLFSQQARGFAHLDMAKDFPLLIDLLDFSTSFFLIFIDELAESAEAIVQVCSYKLLACFYDIYFHGFFCKLGQNFTGPQLSWISALHKI